MTRPFYILKQSMSIHRIFGDFKVQRLKCNASKLHPKVQSKKSDWKSSYALQSGHTHGEQFVQTCDIQLRYMSWSLCNIFIINIYINVCYITKVYKELITTNIDTITLILLWGHLHWDFPNKKSKFFIVSILSEYHTISHSVELNNRSFASLIYF